MAVERRVVTSASFPKFLVFGLIDLPIKEVGSWLGIGHKDKDILHGLKCESDGLARDTPALWNSNQFSLNLSVNSTKWVLERCFPSTSHLLWGGSSASERDTPTNDALTSG